MLKSPSDVSLFAQEEREDAIIQFKIDTLSRFYAFSSDEIIKYSSVLNFDRFHLMDNPNIMWDAKLISGVKGKIDWNALWKLKNIKLDIDFFKTFENLIDFQSIQISRNILWTDEIIEIYGDKFDWSKYLINTKGLSKITNLRRFADRLNWKMVSSGINLEFTEEIIDEFVDRWDWKSLSSNPNLPLSVEFVNKYKDKIDFNELSKNPASLPLIYRYPYSRKWNWGFVIINRGIHYDQEVFDFMFKNYNKWFIERYNDSPIYKQFALSSFINSIMCGLYGDHSFFLNDKYYGCFSWDRISKYCRTKLSLDFIDANKENLNFKESNLLGCIKETVTNDFIRQNHGLFDKSPYIFYSFPLSIDLLQIFWDEIDWFYLSSCEKLDWTWDFLKEHFDNFKIDRLSTNKGIYERLFSKSTETDEFIEFLDNQLLEIGRRTS